MVNMLRYPAAITRLADDDYELRFRDVPEAITGGRTPEEALANALDALEAALEGYIELGREIPTATAAVAGEEMIDLGPAVALRALLVNAMRAKALNKSALAARMGRDEKVVRRILSGRNASMELTLQALHAADVRPVIGIVG